MTILRSNTVYLVLALAVVLPFLLPMLTNYNVDKMVVEPARAQAAWQFSWIAGMFWLLFQAASLGGEFKKSGMGAYFASGGVNGGAQLTGIWLALLAILVPLCAIPALVSWFAARPADVLEAQHWGVLCVQHGVVMMLVFGGLTMLAVGLASRFGVIMGYLGALGVVVVGFYGVGVLENLVLSGNAPVSDLFYVVLPHFHLGDLTHRFVSKQGAVAANDFVVVFEYLAGWCLLLTGLGTVCYSTK